VDVVKLEASAAYVNWCVCVMQNADRASIASAPQPRLSAAAQ
jgi:hypothetical protein